MITIKRNAGYIDGYVETGIYLEDVAEMLPTLVTTDVETLEIAEENVPEVVKILTQYLETNASKVKHAILTKDADSSMHYLYNCSALSIILNEIAMQYTETN